MEIQEIKVEFVDKNSRFVLKRIKTKEGEEFLNRKLAVCNFVYSCEKSRDKYGQSPFDSPFQTHHIGWDSNDEEWDYKGLKKRQEHSEKNNRVFAPYKQRNENQWEKLNWKEALEEVKYFQKITKIVPFPIPLKASNDEFKSNKKKALKLLEPKQELMPIISSKHLNLDGFSLIIKEALQNFKFVGICCYGIKDIIERRNLSYLTAINSSFNVGEDIALIFSFDYKRILTNYSYISGCFAFSCFAGDVFSERAYFPKGWGNETFDKVMTGPKNYFLYDIKEKKFTKSKSQKKWYGIDFTSNLMGQISVNEGLSGYNSIKWVNHHLQQKDLDWINELLISKRDMVKMLNDFTGWSVFWNTTRPNKTIIQETLI